ncbi:hypothetical protein D3C72_2180240 [compost metagenome]
MLETDQVHRRALQFQFQCLAIKHHVKTGNTVFVGGEAAMSVVMIVVVVLMGMSDGQGQQGEWQGKEYATHGQTPREHRKCLVML